MKSLPRFAIFAVVTVLLACLFSALSNRIGMPLAVLSWFAVNVLASSFFVSPRLGAGSSVFGRNLADKDLQDDAALPNGAATSYSDAFKLGPGVHADDIEIEVTIPDATTAEAPDTRTLTVDLVAGDTSTPTTAASLPRVFTGAGGAGFAGATYRLKIAVTSGDYVRLRMVGSASFGNMSAKSATIRILQ